jgi:hypothetical protein
MVAIIMGRISIPIKNPVAVDAKSGMEIAERYKRA